MPGGRRLPGGTADAYTVALTLLSSRELSEHQLRQRLRRRELDHDDIESTIARLKSDGTLNDKRVALALARMESAIKSRGRARVIQKVRQAGIDDDTAQDAVNAVFADEVDENALLDRALERKLRGQSVRDLDHKARARVMRALVAQGFAFAAVMNRLKP